MPRSLFSRIIVATTATAVVALTGGTAVAAAEPHAPATVAAAKQQQLKHLWQEFSAGVARGDTPKVKADTHRILRAVPQSHSLARSAAVGKARSAADELPPTIPAPATAVCDLIASLVHAVGNLLGGLLGAPLPPTVPSDPCGPLPVPPEPVPTS